VVVVAAVMVVVMAVVVVLVCGGGGGGGDAKLRCPGGREVSRGALVRAPSDWSACRRARSTETAAAAAPGSDVNVTGSPSAIAEMEWSAGSVCCSFDSIMDDVIATTRRY